MGWKDPLSLIDSFGGHLYPFHGTVFVIIEPVDTDGTAVTSTVVVDPSVVINKVPCSLEFNNGLVVGIAVPGNFTENAFILPRAVDILAHGVTDLFGEFGGVRKVIPLSAFVYPRGFCKAGKLNGHNGTIEFDHILFEPGIVALGVSPEEISLAIVVNIDRGVDVVPGDLSVPGSHIIGDDSGATGIFEWAYRRVGYGYANGFAFDLLVLYRYIPVEFTVAFNHPAGPGFSFGPAEIGSPERNGVFCPGFQVGRGEYQPFVELIVLTGRRTFVMACIDIYFIVINQCTRVCRVFMGKYRVAGGYKGGICLCGNLLDGGGYQQGGEIIRIYFSFYLPEV